MMAVDILPTALPAAASAHFSAVLVPHLRAVAAAYGGAPYGDAIERATVARAGVLREEHRWLEDRVRAWRGAAAGEVRPEKRKNVLVLGSGMVAAPAVDEIARHADVRVVVGALFCSFPGRRVADRPQRATCLLTRSVSRAATRTPPPCASTWRTRRPSRPSSRRRTSSSGASSRLSLNGRRH